MGDTIYTVKRKPVNRLRYFLKIAFLLIKGVFGLSSARQSNFYRPFVFINFLENIYVLFLC